MATAQSSFPDGHLDPTRDQKVIAPLHHQPLPEQYIWTAGDVTALRPDHGKYAWNKPELRIAPHYFRDAFEVKALPPVATLYLAGPRSAKVYLNGELAGEFTSDIDTPIGFHVFRCDVSRLLHVGRNVLAIEAVRGRGIVSGSGSAAWAQLAYGEVLVAKILPAAAGVEATPLVITNAQWKSSAALADGWQRPGFKDAGWASAESLGSVEGNLDLFQWNADAGMYDWPGYMGMSPWLRTYRLDPVQVSHVFAAQGQFAHVESLTEQNPKQLFTVALRGTPTDAEAPALLLDFGREVAGRIYVRSACSCQAILSVAYGESEDEAMNSGVNGGHAGGNYVGVNLLHVPPLGAARGPKSAFRYVRIRFLRGANSTAFREIRLEGIYYPLHNYGSFTSSDTELNRIWEASAYTAHLCMQDGVWDAPKRDRGLWAGDLDVTGRVISDVSGDSFLLQKTLAHLYPADGHEKDVNGIPGYSALWISTMASLYRSSGDVQFVQKGKSELLELLQQMDAEVNTQGIFENPRHRWLFVDWAPGMYADNQETRVGTDMEFYRAYRDAAFLLQAAGDTQNADRYEQQAAKLLEAARSHLQDAATGTFGQSWQLNAMAVFSGIAAPQSYDGIWQHVLAHVKQDSPQDQGISPYFNDYVLEAMAKMGHRKAALAWMKQYWGGMLAEGATSMWESYDLRWPKGHPHLSLQADGTTGYFVSLAHGWSSGPAAWLMEQVLGITPAAPGFRRVEIRPDLMGLEWAKGEEPTPLGPIKVSLSARNGGEYTVEIPLGMQAEVSLPAVGADVRVMVNGAAQTSTSAENGTRREIELYRGGRYTVRIR